MASSVQFAATGEIENHDVEDAVERLFAAGLIHRVGGFVFATRAAHCARRLAS